MKTKLVKCGCKNDWQDKKYGNNVRVMNHTAKEDMYRCTSCGKTTEKKKK